MTSPTLPPSGLISITDVENNLEISTTATTDLGDPRVRALANKKTGAIELGDLYGKDELDSVLVAASNGVDSTGYLEGQWGTLTPNTFVGYVVKSAYDKHDENKFVFTLHGNVPRTAFHALIVNVTDPAAKIYYEADATTYAYQSGSDSTSWTWVGSQAGFGNGSTYELSYCVTTATPAPSPAPAPEGPFPYGQGTNWILTFEDNFDSVFLDTSKWTDHIWYETSDPVINYAISNGDLLIWPDTGYVNRHITTDGKFEQQYGYFEAEIKYPIGRGIRISFWLLAHASGETPYAVIAQAIPGFPDNAWATTDYHPIDVVSQVEPGNGLGSYDEKRAHDALGTLPDLSAAHHKYGVKWDEAGMTFYFDGQPFWTRAMTGPNAINQRMFFVLSIIRHDVANGPPSASITPQGQSNSFDIRYVRAWRAGIPPTGGGTQTPTPDETVAFYGNSTLWGYHVPDGSQVAVPPPKAFAQKLPQYFVRNEAVNSKGVLDAINGTDGVHPAWTTEMSQSLANWVVLGHGTNDQWDMTPATFASNLKVLIDGALAVGKKVVIMTPCYGQGSLIGPIAQAARDQAAASTVPVLDVFNYTKTLVTNGTGNILDYFPDGVHPSDSVYTLMGQYMADRWVPDVLSYLAPPPPAPAPAPAPTPGVFSATLTAAPADGAVISGLVTITVSGNLMQNVELVPPNSYLPIYGTFTLNGAGTSATLNWNTAALPNGTLPFRVLAYDQPAGSNANEIAAMPSRTWTINNGVPAPSPSPSPSPPMPAGFVSGWALTFEDNFDGTSLNFNVWNDHLWYASSDPTINYSVEGGELLIWPQSPFVNRTIDTDGKYYQLYGFFEMEAKLPIGAGCWPAFWLYEHESNGGSGRGEIDVMEAYSGGGPSSGWSDSNLHPNNYTGTVWSPNVVEQGQRKLGDYLAQTDLSAAYHKYGAKWEASGITFYFDGAQLGPKVNTTALQSRMYILLDLWFGSASGSASTSGTPQGKSNAYRIRYVRAWRAA
jgi:beta-glucanase (GH16 family)